MRKNDRRVDGIPEGKFLGGRKIHRKKKTLGGK